MILGKCMKRAIDKTLGRKPVKKIVPVPKPPVVVVVPIEPGATTLNPSWEAPTLVLVSANANGSSPQLRANISDDMDIAQSPVLRLENRSSTGSVIASYTDVVDLNEAANGVNFGLSSKGPGTNRFYIRFEQAGQHSPWSAELKQGPDDIAPTFTSANPSGTYPEMTTIAGKLTVNEPGVTFSVTGPQSAGVTLNAATGDWSYVPDFETAPNPVFTFVATDAAGNPASQIVNFTITDVTEVSFGITEVAATNIDFGYSTQASFPAQNLGTPDPSRFIVALVGHTNGGGARPTGFELDGVAGTLIEGSHFKDQSFWLVPMPTGTSAVPTIKSNGMSQRYVRLFRLVGDPNPTPTEILNLNYEFRGAPYQITPNTPAGGASIIVAQHDGSGGTMNWTNANAGATINNDTWTVSAAIRTGPNNTTVSASGPSAIAGMIAVSFQP